MARLSLINMSGLVSALAADGRCGFKDPNIQHVIIPDAIQQSDIYETGSASWETSPNCVLDFPEPTSLSSDCKNDQVIVQGKLTVEWAKQTRSGVLTGANYQPVIPQGESPVKLEIKNARFENFRTWFSSNPEQFMHIKDGTLNRADIDVHLAKDAQTELCSVQIPNVTINKYEFDGPIEANIPGYSDRIDLTIDSLSIRDSQVGIFYKADGSTVTNTLFGTVNLWGNLIEVPTDDQGLDPNFTPDFFVESIVCEKMGLDVDLSPPLQFDCNMDKFIAKNTLRLMTRNINGLMTLAKDNIFYWTNVISDNYQFHGKFGEPGSVSIKYTDNKEVGQIAPLSIDGDDSCLAENHIAASFIEGKARLKTSIFNGNGIIYDWGALFGPWLTTIPGLKQKRPFNSVIKIEADNFDLAPEGFSSFNLEEGVFIPPVRLQLLSGSLKALAEPLFTINSEENCYYQNATSIAKAELQTVEPMNVRLNIRIPDESTPVNDQHVTSFNYRVDSTHFKAMNGIYMGDGNYIRSGVEGATAWDAVPIIINNKDLSRVPFKLDPSYNFEEFNRGYVCEAAKIPEPVPETGLISEICGY